MAIIIVIPLLVRREVVTELYNGDFLSFHYMIYFTEAYAAGMFLAVNLEASLVWINRNRILLALLVLVSSGSLLYFILNDLDRIGVFSIHSSLYYVQKIALSLLILLFFKELGEKQPKWLQPIAKDAFTIFFLHVWFIFILLGYLEPIPFVVIIISHY